MVWLIWIWLKSAKLSSKRIVPTYQEAYNTPRLTPPCTSYIPYLYSCSRAFSAFSSANTSTVPSLFLPEEKDLAKMDIPNHTLRTFLDMSIYWEFSTLSLRTSLCGTQFCSLPIRIHLHSEKPVHLPPSLPVSSFQYPSDVPGNHTIGLKSVSYTHLTLPTTPYV